MNATEIQGRALTLLGGLGNAPGTVADRQLGSRRRWSVMDAATMADLQQRVLTQYAVELAEAVMLAVVTGDSQQFEHVARRAECRTRGDLGRRERALVDWYRARYAVVAPGTPVGGAR